MSEAWTPEERELVLDYYGLESLAPDEWPATLVPAPLALPAVTGGGLVTPSSLVSARALLKEDKDPLGINNVHYIKQVQRLAELSNRGAASTVASTAGSTENLADASALGKSVLLSQPNFDSRFFLREVHFETGFRDLLQGRHNLKDAVEQRNETLRNLVKQNFDRFVNAKNTIDEVYADMKARQVTSGDYGTKKANDTIMQAYRKAVDIYQPLMNRRNIEEKTRKRLAIFEQYKFLFGLPASMKQAIDMGEYQVAVHDYRKGLVLLAETTGAIRKLLDDVWTTHVEKMAAILRSDLFAKLSDSRLPFEFQAKVIGFLYEMDAHPDPIEFYMNAQTAWLAGQVQIILGRTMAELKNIKAGPDNSQLLRLCVHLLQSRSSQDIQRMPLELFSLDLRKLLDLDNELVRGWQTRLNMFAQISAILANFLPDFSKFVLALIDGHLIPSQSAAMSQAGPAASENLLVDQFAKKFAQLLTNCVQSVLSPDAFSSLPKDNAAIVAVFGAMIMTEYLGIVEKAELVLAPGEIKSALRSTCNETKAYLVEHLWRTAQENCKVLASQEDWKLTGEGQEFSTALMKAFEAFIMYLVNLTSKILQLYRDVAEGRQTHQALLDATGIEALLQLSVENFLQGMIETVVPPSAAANTELRRQQKVISLTKVEELPDSITLPTLAISYQLLTVITNAIYMKSTCVPKIASSFAEAYLGALSQNMLNEIMGRIEDVDKTVSGLYIQDKAHRIIATTRRHMIETSFDWNGALPDYNRSLSKWIMLELVAIQTEISDVSRAVLRKLMSQLVLVVFSEYLSCLHKIRCLGPGGYIQAKFEMDFLNSKLLTIQDKETIGIVQNIYETLEIMAETKESPDSDVNLSETILAQQIELMDKECGLHSTCFQYS